MWIMDFMRAAAKWVLMGVVLAVFFVRQANRNEDSEKQKSSGAGSLWIGMCFGVAVGAAIGQLTMGLLLGLLLGMVIDSTKTKEIQQKEEIGDPLKLAAADDMADNSR